MVQVEDARIGNDDSPKVSLLISPFPDVLAAAGGLLLLDGLLSEPMEARSLSASPVSLYPCGMYPVKWHHAAAGVVGQGSLADFMVFDASGGSGWEQEGGIGQSAGPDLFTHGLSWCSQEHKRTWRAAL